MSDSKTQKFQDNGVGRTPGVRFLPALGAVLLAVAAVFPAVLREMYPRALHGRLEEIWAVDLDPTLSLYEPGWGWLLLGILSGALVLGLWERRPHEALLGLVFLGLTGPLLSGLLAAASRSKPRQAAKNSA